jgi:HSP20 family protein
MEKDLLGLDPRLRAASGAWPRVERSESDGVYQLKVELPGVRQEDINIHSDGDQLTVEAVRADAVPEGYKVLRKERPALRFKEQYKLQDADIERISARYSEGGVLTIEVPKRAGNLPRQIPVVAEACKTNEETKL